MIAHVPVKVTDEDVLLTAAENPGWKVERDQSGQLVMTPPTGGESARRNSRLTRLLDEWAEANDFISFDSNGGFRLADSSIVAPDGALVGRASWNALSKEDREGIVPLVPAVAVELSSKTDEPIKLQAKLERLLSAGATYVVLIDPYRKTIWERGARPHGFDLDFSALLE